MSGFTDYERFLADLEERIDPAVEEDLLGSWRSFADGRFEGDIFSPRRREKSSPRLEWPRVTVNRALDDPHAMVLQQFGACSAVLERGRGEVLCVRANYGSSILPSLFGVRIYRMEEKLDTLPTSYPLAGGLDDMKRILDDGLPHITDTLAQRALDMGGFFKEIAAKHPKISRYVDVYHPDLQGPMDVCELLIGSTIFIHACDQPDLIKDFLELITRIYIQLLDRWYELFPSDGQYSVHWHAMHKGRIMLRDDSAMNFSPEMFDELIRPYDQALLDRYGGGAIHFCGRGDHYIDRLPRMNGVHAVAMSQPECNDMERIYSNTVDENIQLICFSHKAAQSAIDSGRDLHRNVQTWGG